MRFHKGIKAEEEVNDFVRRSKNGRLQKTLGDEEKDLPPQIVGCGDSLYGYDFVTNKKGTHVGYKLKYDVIHIEPDRTEWTEVKLVIFMFESAAHGVSLRGICRLLNEKGIPTPHETKGKQRYIRMREEACWQHNTIKRIINNTAYYGQYVQFKTVATGGRIPGHKSRATRPSTKDEQVIISIPAIVTEELYEKANRRIQSNKQLATRNNQTSKKSLLRGGFAKCAYCGGTLHASRLNHTNAAGEATPSWHYQCSKPLYKRGRCSGCSIPVDVLDPATQAYILEKIHDPSEVDAKITALQKENPEQKRQQKKLKNLNDILRDQQALRSNLAAELKKKTMSGKTVAFLNTEIASLEQQEQEARENLADELKVQQQREQLQERITAFHQQCQIWQQEIDDPQFTPDFQFYRDALLFLGISVTVWKVDTKPRYVFHIDPPEIVELLS